MKRNIMVVIMLAIVLIVGSTIVWRVHGKSVRTSGTNQIPTPVGTVSAVYDKLDTSGDYPPIIFSRNGNLYAVYPNGTGPVLLTNTDNNSDAYYLPEEGKLLFIKDTAKDIDGGDVACIDFRTGQESVLLPASAFKVAPKDYPGTGFILPQLAPTGDKLVVLEGNELSGGGTVLTASSAGKGLGLIRTYAVSYVLNPKGTGMAFTNDPGGYGPSLIYNLAWGHSPVALIPNDWNGIWAGSYDWRPDGGSIAFFGHTGHKGANTQDGLKNGIYIVTITGRLRQVCLLPRTSAYGLHWLSNDQLAFIDTSATGNSNAGVFNFYRVNVYGGKPEVLARVKESSIMGRVDWPEWSWNPANNAFVFQKKGHGSLWVKYLARTTEEKLPGTAGADNLNLTWGKNAYANFQP